MSLDDMRDYRGHYPAICHCWGCLSIYGKQDYAPRSQPENNNPAAERREPHIWTPAHDGRLFPLMTQDQPDTAERTRLAVQTIPFALPEKRNA